jgi:hypothetical protein
MASSVNDAIMALLLLIAFAVLRWPFARGALIGAAAMVKFAPLVALAPMLHVGESRRLRQAALAIGGAASIIAAGLAWTVWRIDDGVSGSLNLFWQRTLGFQVERGSPFSPWGLYDLAGSQRVVQGLVVIMLVIMSLRPRARDAWQVAAGVAAALIAAQLVVTHWFYLYVPWFIGFVLIVLVAARERPWLAPPHEQHAGAEPDMLTP